MNFPANQKKDLIDMGDGFRHDDVMNPISRKYVKRLLSIDTMFRPHYASTDSADFIFNVPDHIKKVVSMKISSIEMPNTIYMFSAKNYSNTFKVTIDDEVHTIVMQDGTSSDIEVFVQTLNDMLFSMGITKLTVTYHPSGRLSFDYSSDTPEGNFSMDFTSTQAKYRQNAGWAMGFRNNLYECTITEGTAQTTDENGTIQTTTVYTGSIDADSIYGASVDKYIFIDIDDYQRNFLTGAVVAVVNNTSTGNSSCIGNNIMAKIPMASNPNFIMLNNGADQLFKTREYFGPVKLEKIRIRLLNRFGDVVNLNNEDYSIALEITELY
jgi:hypothetical protein